VDSIFISFRIVLQ